MNDRPILFSGPMVLGLIREIERPGTGKTQTRRVLNPQPGSGIDGCYFRPDGQWIWLICGGDQRADNRSGGPGIGASEPFKASYAVGDRLWAREAWRSVSAYDDLAPSQMGGEEPIRYEADGVWASWTPKVAVPLGRFRQGMHMPRWASRLTLIVTDVRVQRVQEISPEDARDEGVNRRSPKVRQMWLFGASAEERESIYLRACPWEFEDLWNAINGPRGFGWSENPWVVAVTFTVQRGNIDQVRP